MDELCKDPRVKKDHNGSCDDFIQAESGAFSYNQIEAIGKTTNFCKTISSQSLNDLGTRVQTMNGDTQLLAILSTRCIKELAEHQSSEFDLLYNNLNLVQRVVLMKKNDLCSSQRKFQNTAAEDELKTYCKDKKLKDEKASSKMETLELEKKKEELVKKLGENPNSAYSVTISTYLLISVMALATLL